MEIVARKLVEWNPEEPGHFADLAYATRRARSLSEAHAILTHAAERHLTDAMILRATDPLYCFLKRCLIRFSYQPLPGRLG
jgi:hypothetical protein